jgi:uncharacterized protein YlzI (FlbEa/FlbD family)
MSKLLKHINEYFNTFNNKDYTIYVDGTPTEWCSLNINTHRVVWNIPSNSSEREWYFVNVSDIEAIRLTPTTMEIVKTNGKEYKLAARLKSKEKKAKNIILKVKNALYARHIPDALNYLDELNDLMDE